MQPNRDAVPGQPSQDDESTGSHQAAYKRFTDRARKIMHLANKEALRASHKEVDTQHVLCGMLVEGSGVAGSILKMLDVNADTIRLEASKIVPDGSTPVPMSERPLSERSGRIVEQSHEEARKLNHNYVGTEHLLLALVHDAESTGSRVLINLGLKLTDVRNEVLSLLGHGLE